MPAIAYTVVATLPDEGVAREYIAWLDGGHVDEVVRGGAQSGMIVRIEDPSTPIRVETRYIFATRERFEEYLRTTAPRLREEGLRRFPPERGVTFERRIGVVV